MITLHRIFIAPENINDKRVVIDEEQARHIEKVLRLKTGNNLIAFDGSGNEYSLRLAGRVDGNLVGEIDGVQGKIDEPSLRLILVQGIAKGDKMDTIVQKAVELGISIIYPVVTRYTVVRLEQKKAAKKVERWQIIAREACKQCRRSIIPEVKPVMELLNLYSVIGSKPAIMLYEKEIDTRLKTVLQQKQNRFNSNELYLLVGPEGGFSDYEVTEAKKQGILTAGLGPRILRTETAGLAAASIIMYEYGDLG